MCEGEMFLSLRASCQQLPGLKASITPQLYKECANHLYKGIYLVYTYIYIHLEGGNLLF